MARTRTTELEELWQQWTASAKKQPKLLDYILTQADAHLDRIVRELQRLGAPPRPPLADPNKVLRENLQDERERTAILLDAVRRAER